LWNNWNHILGFPIRKFRQQSPTGRLKQCHSHLPPFFTSFLIGNSKKIGRFAYWARWLVYKWLNRRSQRKSFTVASFDAAWERWQMPTPRVIEEPWPRTALQNQPRRV
jgi:hypothetical protein